MSKIDSIYQKIDSTNPRLVFLTGKTSTGKTTLSNALQDKYNCAVIELDEVIYKLDCAPGKNRFIEAYQKRDDRKFTSGFVEAVRSEIRIALDTHDYAIIEGAIVNVETLNEIISEWSDSFLFIYLDLKNIDVYTERLKSRFVLSTPENRNGLPELFWEKFSPAELKKYYADREIISGIENSINEYAEESIKASEIRLAAFSAEFDHILKIEI